MQESLPCGPAGLLGPHRLTPISLLRRGTPEVRGSSVLFPHWPGLCSSTIPSLATQQRCGSLGRGAKCGDMNQEAVFLGAEVVGFHSVQGSSYSLST